jgi:hypothetical protein
MELSGQLYALGERAPGTHWIGDWVGPRRGEEKNLAPTGIRTPTPPSAVQPVASRYTDCGIPAPRASAVLMFFT